MSQSYQTGHTIHHPALFKFEIKKTLLALVCLFFALLLVAISILSVTRVNAEEQQEPAKKTQEVMDQSGDNSATAAADKQEHETKSTYLLPYPGILPDHPLYWAKMIRDRIRLWVTTSPADKLDLLILYADKRLGAGKALIDGNKKSLGVTTITKAAKYLERAAAEEAKITAGNNEFKNKLRLSAQKHQEVLNEIKAALPDSHQKTWFDSYRIIEQVNQQLDK